MPTLTDPQLLRSDAYVDGAWTPAGAGGTIPVSNPATGEILAQVANLEPGDARAAIEAAAAAFPAWSAKTAKERAAVLRRWFELIMAAQEDLAQLMTALQGKPLADTRGEVAYGASFFVWFA
jgi:succinate-semialdehyde dehydrogenase / glutarate-semialdehyde dehydrogenase